MTGADAVTVVGIGILTGCYQLVGVIRALGRAFVKAIGTPEGSDRKSPDALFLPIQIWRNEGEK